MAATCLRCTSCAASLTGPPPAEKVTTEGEEQKQAEDIQGLVEVKLDEKLATYFDLIRKQLLDDREVQLQGIQALIANAKDDAEKQAMSRVKNAIEVDAKDTTKMDAMCRAETTRRP